MGSSTLRIMNLVCGGSLVAYAESPVEELEKFHPDLISAITETGHGAVKAADMSLAILHIDGTLTFGDIAGCDIGSTCGDSLSHIDNKEL